MHSPPYPVQPQDILHRLIDPHLNRLAERRTEEYIDAYATDAHGARDEQLASHIRREVHRRAAMGRELDIYEPLRWTAASAALSALTGIGLKAALEKNISTPAVTMLMASTGIGAAIQLLRLYPRYDAGLRGGVDTAFAMRTLEDSNWSARMDARERYCTGQHEMT